MTTPARVLTADVVRKVIPKALYFDGKSYYVVLANPIVGSSSFTVIGFLYRTKVSSYHDDNNWITGNRIPDYSWYSAFDLYDRLGVWFYGSGWAYGPVVPRNQWHMVGFVVNGVSYSANNLGFILDGRIVSYTTISYTLSQTTSKPWIGGRTDLSRYFGGYIADVKIYNRALSDSEIYQLYAHPLRPPLDGLILWLKGWPEFIHDGVWWDASGYNNHGTIYGAQVVDV